MESKRNLKKCSVLKIGPHLRDAFMCKNTFDNCLLSSNEINKDLGILTLNNFQFLSHCFLLFRKLIVDLI